MPKPAEASLPLFDRLRRLADQGVPDELELKRLEREATTLLKSDASRAQQILGGVAAIRWDIDAMRSHHEAALQSGRPATYRNYAISLQLVGLLPEAAERMAQACDRQPENLSWLRSACLFFLWAGQPTNAIRVLGELGKRDPEHKRDLAARVKALEYLLNLLDKHRISEADLQAAMSFAFQFLRERNLRFSHVSLANDDEQGTSFFTIHVVQLSVNQVIALDGELGRLFADQMPDLSSALVVQFEPQPKQSQKRANDGQAARPS